MIPIRMIKRMCELQTAPISSRVVMPLHTYSRRKTSFGPRYSFTEVTSTKRLLRSTLTSSRGLSKRKGIPASKRRIWAKYRARSQSLSAGTHKAKLFREHKLNMRRIILACAASSGGTTTSGLLKRIKHQTFWCSQGLCILRTGKTVSNETSGVRITLTSNRLFR